MRYLIFLVLMIKHFSISNLIDFDLNTYVELIIFKPKLDNH